MPETDCHLRLRVKSYMIDALTEDEEKAYPDIKFTLNEKWQRKELEVDILLMQEVCWRKNWIITEVMCRRLINKFEFEEVGKKIFTIKNGSPQWEDE